MHLPSLWLCRRFGSPTSKITAAYIAAASKSLDTYIKQSLTRGEVPESAVWVLQYMYPENNGHRPASDSGIAWPHIHLNTLFVGLDVRY